MNSLEQALAAHCQNDQVNMNSVLGMLQRANSGECTQISVFNVPYQSEPNNHPQEETAEDLQMAMLKIDSELLKVKQLKLKAMQDKLKMQLEMKRKMEN
jgi:DNA polymerase III delta prime subunit